MPKITNERGSRSMDVCMHQVPATITGRVGKTREVATVTQNITCGKRLRKNGTCPTHGASTA